jgi:hypothetical protein
MQASQVLDDRKKRPWFARGAERTHDEELNPGVHVAESSIDGGFLMRSYREAPRDLVMQDFHKRRDEQELTIAKAERVYLTFYPS